MSEFRKVKKVFPESFFKEMDHNYIHFEVFITLVISFIVSLLTAMVEKTGEGIFSSLGCIIRYYFAHTL